MVEGPLDLALAIDAGGHAFERVGSRGEKPLVGKKRW
jgi:hypothetical protein